MSNLQNFFVRPGPHPRTERVRISKRSLAMSESHPNTTTRKGEQRDSSHTH